MFDRRIINGIKNFMVSGNETIAVAESVTAGLLQTALAMATDASQFFQGGITAYNLGQKYRHLLIEPIHAASCNCVSERVAREMALHVCDMFTSDWGIGVTGYATPVPESDNELYAFYAISYKGTIELANKLTSPKQEPLKVQEWYVQQLLKDFFGYIQNKV